jgi:hypothetical protein
VLLSPIDGPVGSILALLEGDQARWTTSALLDALGSGQRTLQRASRPPLARTSH